MFTQNENIVSRAPDVFSVLKQQHDQLRRLIKVLKDSLAGPSEKQYHLIQFIELLNVHCKAEEQTLYRVLKDISESQNLTFEAFEDHAVAKILIDELKDADYENTWSPFIEAKAKTLAVITETHMLDEENVIFSAAQNLLTEEELRIIGEEFNLAYNTKELFKIKRNHTLDSFYL